MREIEEETGLTVSLEQVLDAGESELLDRTIADIFMLAQPG